jgi:hypothetical protein
MDKRKPHPLLKLNAAYVRHAPKAAQDRFFGTIKKQ